MIHDLIGWKGGGDSSGGHTSSYTEYIFLMFFPEYQFLFGLWTLSYDLECIFLPVVMKKFIENSEQCLTESGFRGTVAAVMYGTCSVSMAFINKALMTTMEFDFPVFIMVIQMVFTITILEALSCVNLIEMPRYTLQRGKSFALPAFFYGLNSVLGLSALSHMNVAMYGVLKRCVPLVTMFLSVAILKKSYPSRATFLSVILLTMGCVIAGKCIYHFF